MSKVLFIAPHPDDETLGAGGSILKHREDGDEIFWLLFTAGNEEQEKVIGKIADAYRFEDVRNLGFPDAELDRVPVKDLIGEVTSYIREIKPDQLYIPNRSDIHSDHRIAFDSIIPATKNFRYPSIKKVLMYEVLSETEFAPAISDRQFTPTVFTDITAYFDQKVTIAKLFESEMMAEYQPRSISSIGALNRYRGSRIGVEYAEAFQLLLEIN